MSKTRTRTHWIVLLAQVSILSVLALRSSHLAAASDDTDPPGRVARLSYLHGPVSFQPAGENDWVGAVANRPLTTGDRLWTDGGDARAELTMGSATIRLGASTDFAFINLDDRIVQVQLTQGTVLVRVQRLHRDEVVEVDTPNQAFSILEPGSYRVEADEDGTSTLVTVRAGEGEASGGGDVFTVHSGQSTRFIGTDRLEATDEQAGRIDGLDEWAQARDRRAEASASARYVSPDVVGYEDLDDNGTWMADSSYGHVWMPTRVESGWAPYHDGHWAWISPWGYTWVDDAPWGYAPFHYGRWVTIRGRWGWVPGPPAVEAVYAPALVAFIGGPGFGLSVSIGGGGSRAEVGWFPLGPREVYVPAYHVSRGYVDRVNVSNTQVNTTTITNVYNTQTTNQYRVTNVTYVNRTAPGAVTVVPQQAFASAQPVARAAVKVNEQRIAAAPIGPSAAAVPTRNAVLGASRVEGAPRPPPAAAGRSVVAKAPAPPPPVPFASQQKVLEAHPGQPLARKELESIRPSAAAAAQPMVRQAPPGKPAAVRNERAPAPAKPAEQAEQPPAPKPTEQATQPPAPKPGERVVQQPGPAKPAEQAAQPPAPKPEERAVQQPGPAKPAEQAAQPPAPKPEERAVQQPGPAKPAEQAAQPPAPKPEERAVQQPAPVKPAEQVAQPPAPKPGERVVRQPPPAKPAEQAAQPPAPKPGERVVRQPAKPAEQAAQPPAPKPGERVVRQPAPAKPAEQVTRPPSPKQPDRVVQPGPAKPADRAAQPPAPKPPDRVVQPGPGPAKPAERAAQPPPSPRQAQDVAPPQAPRAAARAPQRTERPPASATQRAKQDENGKTDGRAAPTEEKPPR